jgi:hypothetical protein
MALKVSRKAIIAVGVIAQFVFYQSLLMPLIITEYPQIFTATISPGLH